MKTYEFFRRTAVPENRYDYDGSNQMIYHGIHETPGAATSDGTWLIWKLTYTSTNLTRIQGPLKGSWDNRASLAW
jgi:hypothetical protein